MKNQSIDYLINKLLTEENKGSGRKGTSFVDVMIFGHVAFSLPLLHGCRCYLRSMQITHAPYQVDQLI
jgi:hypothetical protein